MTKLFDRRRIDARLQASAERLEADAQALLGKSEAELRSHMHEIELSQIELAVQNLALSELQLEKDCLEVGLRAYTDMYERAPVAYFSLTQDGAIERANLAAALLLSVQKSRLIGQPFERFVESAEQPRFRHFLRKAFETGARQVIEVPLHGKGPDRGAVRIEASVDALSGVCRMIVTGMGDAETQEQALRRAFVVFDNINEGVMVTDLSSRLVSVNPAYTAITGYRAEEAIGRNPSFMSRGGYPKAFFQEMYAELSAKGTWQGELWNRHKNGMPYVEWLSITVVRGQDGQPTNYVGIFSDITKRKQTEFALREAHRELDNRVAQRTAELMEANQALREEIAERERVQRALQHAERFFHSTIDALSDRVLVLDADGVIVHSNETCRAFAGHNGPGVDYLRYCAEDKGWQRNAGLELAEGIRSVMNSSREDYTLEYEFHNRGTAYWFHAKASRFPSPEGRDAPLTVVSHTDITARKSMERALRQSHAQLRQLAMHLETVKEDERKRISRDVHDELGQNLLALRIDISMLSARTSVKHPRLNGRVNKVLDNLDQTIRSVRGIINELRPLALDLGLQAALEWQVADFQRRSGVPCRLVVPDEGIYARIGAGTDIILFRMVQEALSNVMRHAMATSAEIELRAAAGWLTLSIRDDGIGITAAQRKRSQGFGLIGIAERIAALGGQFEIGQFRKGAGSRLTLRLPLTPAFGGGD
jgi:PAS domain S-box-containing protein